VRPLDHSEIRTAEMHGIRRRSKRRDGMRLVLAFVIAAMLHAGALAALLMEPTQALDAPGEDVITVDLVSADIDTATKEAGTSTTNSAQAEQAAPVETKPEETPEAVEPPPPEPEVQPEPEVKPEPEPLPPAADEPPPEEPRQEQLPPAEEAEMPLPPPPPEKVVEEQKESEKKIEKPKPEKPSPVRKKDREQKASAAESAGSRGARKSDVSGRGASADPTALTDYLAAVRSRVERNKRYPAAAQREGITGTAAVRMTITSSGAVRGLRVAKPSGHPALDRAAMAAARAAEPLPAFPKGMPQGRITIVIPMNFNIR
jgi:protein TonB